MNHPTAFCPKCDQLQAIDQGTTLVKETILVDRIEPDSHGVRRIVGQKLIAHTTVELACRHHVTIVMPT